MTARLKEEYYKTIRPKLFKDLNYASIMQVPRLEKIVLNVGIGDAHANSNALNSAIEELSMITGQKAVKTVAKKPISNFKIREGYEVGCRVTIRGDKMYEFLERLISVALPRVRDFRGINDKSFDGRGNYSLGISEQIIFPEIDIDKVNRISGLDITIVTTASTDAEAFALLKEMGMPFKNQRN